MVERIREASVEKGMSENLIIIKGMIDKAQVAQREVEKWTQQQIDDLVAAVAWAGCKKENAEHLAGIAVDETGMGNVEDKITKIRNKTKGTFRDLFGAKSVGIIEVNEKTGLTKIAKPKGVVGALIPVTNPEATPIQNIMIALKGANAIILAPHPLGKKTGKEVVHIVHQEMAKVKAPLDLVQCLENPTIELSQELMRQVDVIVATGGQAMVKAAYSSGKPALGVGVGNAVVIIDETANIEDAVDKISRGKTFDYATSCSSENSVLIQEGLYDRAMEAFKAKGGYVVSAEEKARLQKTMWIDGVINRAIVCQSPQVIAHLAGLTSPGAQTARFFVVEEEGIGEEYPFSGEKLSVVLTAYHYSSFEEALEKLNRIIDYQGRGHSCGIHSTNEEHIQKLALSAKVSRIMVNQVQAFGNGGFFNNGLPFTLTMGCGSWGGNSVTENITYTHLINITHLARVIPTYNPPEVELWGDYWRKYGQ
jgi:sulfoacetaldehyde dehydrogenase